LLGVLLNRTSFLEKPHVAPPLIQNIADQLFGLISADPFQIPAILEPFSRCPMPSVRRPNEALQSGESTACSAAETIAGFA
jgi:hypothetical protein